MRDGDGKEAVNMIVKKQIHMSRLSDWKVLKNGFWDLNRGRYERKNQYWLVLFLD